ncbi:MAG TPA: TIGR02449 family protein [Halieaceae bacterium]|jgi:cell division protein ZapB|uniref:TIGR02449 family protein n=1 Tax=Haliea TaxID=475794 RepID=UPI000C5EEB2C|nr:TIGR02449 family protein [Haliea sp.]HBM83820.1 TIGR02449 family protein [Halieaceae bacterium]MAY92490.1 TIGR02449 family protein [Haliea sp.]MBK40882.1 TIGR02449 family protein [Haliea sp.]MBP68543.1 TIGR02449 family protein [Haliea sp.]HBQ41791.1 TIGR02449 family protein [Halieaceae bacterium]|tara:strand:- start:215 stop:424 length:210 start_codon:yes stop_codon:yes gene_type:complete
MADTQLQTLETRIDELIALCRDLNRENQRLKSENDGWRLERQDLISKNDLARNKVEAMIARLRSMEQRQ